MAAELLQNFETQVADITLVPSDGGRFDVSVDDNLVFSKHQEMRHAEPGEVLRLVKSALKA